MKSYIERLKDNWQIKLTTEAETPSFHKTNLFSTVGLDVLILYLGLREHLLFEQTLPLLLLLLEPERQLALKGYCYWEVFSHEASTLPNVFKKRKLVQTTDKHTLVLSFKTYTTGISRPVMRFVSMQWLSVNAMDSSASCIGLPLQYTLASLTHSHSILCVSLCVFVCLSLSLPRQGGSALIQSYSASFSFSWSISASPPPLSLAIMICKNLGCEVEIKEIYVTMLPFSVHIVWTFCSFVWEVSLNQGILFVLFLRSIGVNFPTKIRYKIGAHAYNVT